MSTLTGESTDASARATNKHLLGIVLGVSTFWLFAQAINIASPTISEDLSLSPSTMSAIVATAGVVCGMVITVGGKIGDSRGHLRILFIGNIINIVGSLLISLAQPQFATVMMLSGRVLQGVSAACIMPATLALVRMYWQGKERQRAISMWSIGSFGASSFTSLFGGLMTETPLGWRSIFVISGIVSVVSILLLRDAPRIAPAGTVSKPDWGGILTFVVGTALLMIVVTQGSALGWGRPLVWLMLLGAVVAYALFVRVEKAARDPFLDFGLFSSRQYRSVTLANFVLNSSAGGLVVGLWVMQLGYGIPAGRVALMTLGFAITVILSMRIGEKMIGRVGVRVPMLMGACFVSVSMFVQIPTMLSTTTFSVLYIVAGALLGFGLAIFATPATDAALSALPEEKSGLGSGIYKMASTLGNGLGIAVATAIYNALNGSGLVDSLIGAVSFAEGGDIATRGAGMITFGCCFLLSLVTVAVILLSVPRRPVSSLDE